MIEERIRAALQSKLPDPPDGFGERNDKLIASLVAGKQKTYSFRGKHRILVPVFVMTIMLMLGIGIAASNGHWGVLNWLSENRSQEISTEQPLTEITDEPFLLPVDTDYGTITVREVKSDGYGIYLSIAFTPKEEGSLALNWAINPFLDAPETAGLVSDYKNQTLAEWAVQHGYRQLLRVGFISDLYQSTNSHSRKETNGSIVYDQLVNGAHLDSYANNTMKIEDNRTSLIMLAGGSMGETEEYKIRWTTVPILMNEDGTWKNKVPEWNSNEFRQGVISFAVSQNNPIDPVILYQYSGTISSLSRKGTKVPVTVDFIRTNLNEYYQIKCADTGRSFQAPWLYLEEGHTRFGVSDIFVYSVREKEGTLIFTVGCQVPDDFPDKLIICWFDSITSFVQETVVERIPPTD